jgi:hypothetical protein
MDDPKGRPRKTLPICSGKFIAGSLWLVTINYWLSVQTPVTVWPHPGNHWPVAVWVHTHEAHPHTWWAALPLQSQQQFPGTDAVPPQSIVEHGPEGRTAQAKLMPRNLNKGLGPLNTAPIWGGRFMVTPQEWFEPRHE